MFEKKVVSFDNGINCFWFDSRKRFESSFNKRFDVTMESSLPGLTEAKGSNHLSTEGLI